MVDSGCLAFHLLHISNGSPPKIKVTQLEFVRTTCAPRFVVERMIWVMHTMSDIKAVTHRINTVNKEHENSQK